MRRWVSALQVGALLSVFVCSAAPAATWFNSSPIDLSARLFAKCFGESTDRLASFSAVTGDAAAESPLRDLALRFDPQAPQVKDVSAVRLPFLDARLFAKATFEAPVVNLSDDAYRPASLRADAVAVSPNELVRAPVIGYYQSAKPSPTDAPLSHHFDLSAWQVNNVQPAFSLTSSDVGSALDAHAATVDGPVKVGRVHFSPHAEADFSQDAQPSLSDRSLTAGTTLDVRAGKHKFGVDLSSGLEHVTLAQPQYSTNTTPNVGLTGEALPVFVPAYADVSAHTISTGVTVPVSRLLTANVQYDMQHLLGGYGGVAPGLNNLDANNTMVGAQVTFKLPKGSSAISLSARQFHYQDNLVPSNAVTQTNANLNYTVKF